MNRILAGAQREHAQLCLGLLGATKTSALHQDPDGERRLRTQGLGSKKFQEALAENKVGRRKEEKAGHTSGKDQARWSSPLTSSSSHPAPRTRVAVTDFAVMGRTCAKAGQHFCPSPACFAMAPPCPSNTESRLRSLWLLRTHPPEGAGVSRVQGCSPGKSCRYVQPVEL